MGLSQSLGGVAAGGGGWEVGELWAQSQSIPLVGCEAQMPSAGFPPLSFLFLLLWGCDFCNLAKCHHVLLRSLPIICTALLGVPLLGSRTTTLAFAPPT